MVYFFRGIADPDAIGKSVFSDYYRLVIRRRNRSPHLEAPSARIGVVGEVAAGGTWGGSTSQIRSQIRSPGSDPVPTWWAGGWRSLGMVWWVGRAYVPWVGARGPSGWLPLGHSQSQLWWWWVHHCRRGPGASHSGQRAPRCRRGPEAAGVPGLGGCVVVADGALWCDSGGVER
jgi:hypothetical protein